MSPEEPALSDDPASPEPPARSVEPRARFWNRRTDASVTEEDGRPDFTVVGDDGVGPGNESAERSVPSVVFADDERVIEISDRIKERERAEKRVFWRRVLLWATALLTALALGWAAFFSPLFALDSQRIAINPAPGRLDLAAVESAAQARAGTPLPRLDVGGLGEEISQIPTVATVDIRRDWPNGLSIDVVPRVPVAAVPTDGGVQLFDAEGVDLGSVPELPEGVPLAEVPLQENTADILTDITVVMGALPPEVRGRVATVRAASADAIEFDLAEGGTVRWGANSENELKASVLATLLGSVQASLYDVSTPRTPMTS